MEGPHQSRGVTAFKICKQPNGLAEPLHSAFLKGKLYCVTAYTRAAAGFLAQLDRTVVSLGFGICFLPLHATLFSRLLRGHPCTLLAAGVLCCNLEHGFEGRDYTMCLADKC